jgi:hypothetical protein
MIIVKIQGGLCNQLFQWMLGYSFSKKYYTKVYYDIDFCGMWQNDPRVGRREFCLNNIVDDEIKIINNDIKEEFNNKERFLVNDDFSQLNFNYNKDHAYYFDGYWQNENYFKEYKNEILSKINSKIISDLDFNDSCSIHVRRGDYLNLQHIHPIQTLEYYKKAIDVIKPKGFIYVFSDDIEWCKENFKFKKMIFMENNSNIDDLKLMSLCHDNIIANSSFSWMGAWLNKNTDKKVVCPKKWFANGQKESHIRPKEWIQV